ncbi:MAG: hypothetical protein ABSC06_38940 [Rhodopila sp.]|jgi:hypothetical protein
MTMHPLSAPSIVDRIKTTLVGLRMPRALEPEPTAPIRNVFSRRGAV